MLPTDTIDPAEDTSIQATDNGHTDDYDTTDPEQESESPEVEELRQKLAAAENEAKRWKGRVEKVSKKEKAKDSPEYITKEDLWERDNKDALEIYSDRVNELMSKGIEGEPVSRKVALKMAMAEASANGGNSVQRSRQDHMTAPDSIRRDYSGGSVEVGPIGISLGLTAERKKELLKENPDLAMLE